MVSGVSSKSLKYHRALEVAWSRLEYPEQSESSGKQN